MKRPLLFSTGADGPDLESMAKNVMDAERLGFKIAWLSDHLSELPPAKMMYDPWTCLGYLGASTKRVMLASGVTDIQRMHPAKMASTVSTLDNLTAGRAVLGIGAGEVMNVKPYGMKWEPPAKRVDRLAEYIQVVRSLWTSSFDDPVTFRGKYYRLDNAHMTGGPYRKPGPPIYVGAYTSPLMMRLIGAHGDGWLPGGFLTPKAFRGQVASIRESAALAGRKREDVDVILNLPVIFGDDRETRERVKRGLRAYLVRNRYLLKLIGAQEAYEYLSESLAYQLVLATPKYVKLFEKAEREAPIKDEHLETVLDQMVAIGSVESSVEVIERFIKAGATHIRISNIFASREGREWFAKRIVPALGRR